MNSQTQTHSQWSVRRDIPIAILAWISLLFVCFWLLSHIGKTVLIFIIASFLAYAIAPVVRLFSRFVPRVAAVLIVYLIVFIAICIVSFFIVNTAIVQFIALTHTFSTLLSSHGGQSSLFNTLHNLGISQQQLAIAGEQLANQAEKITTSIVPFVSSVFFFVFDTFIVAIISIYLILDGSHGFAWIQQNTPVNQQKRIKFLVKTTERVFGGYIRGQLTLAILISLLVGIGMALFNVPYALLLGVLAFLLEFVPILGTIISGFISVLLALTNGWFIATCVLIYFILVHVLEGDILGPRIVGRAIGIHPLVSLLALLAGTELFGIIGALLASPVAGVLQAFLFTLWTEWKETHSEYFDKRLT